MGITKSFSNGVIKNAVSAFKKKVDNETLFLLQSLGENLVKYARERHNYTDRSGHLTNSIGYVVVYKSQIVYSGINTNMPLAQKGALDTAMAMANRLKDEWALIIVAGMNYAAYVEAKGYNVILPAELRAKSDFPAAIQTLTAKVKAKAVELFGK